MFAIGPFADLGEFRPDESAAAVADFVAGIAADLAVLVKQHAAALDGPAGEQRSIGCERISLDDGGRRLALGMFQFVDGPGARTTGRRGAHLGDELGLDRRAVVPPSAADVGQHAGETFIVQHRTAAEARHLEIPFFLVHRDRPGEPMQCDPHESIGRAVHPIGIGERRRLPRLPEAVPLVTRIASDVVNRLAKLVTFLLDGGERRHDRLRRPRRRIAGPSYNLAEQLRLRGGRFSRRQLRQQRRLLREHDRRRPTRPRLLRYGETGDDRLGQPRLPRRRCEC